MLAFISEMHYVGGGEHISNEFVEITLLAGEDPADFTVSFYNSDGALTTSVVSSFLSSPEVTLADIITMVGGDPTVDGDGNFTGDPTGSLPSAGDGMGNFGLDLQVVQHPDDPDALILIIPSDLSDAANPANDTVDNAEAIALTNTDMGVVIDAFDMGPNVTVSTFTQGAAAGTTPKQTIAASGGSIKQDVFGNVTTGGGQNPGGSVICFTEDTLLMTPRGPRRAAGLAIGDLVCTQDSGAQAIVWIKRQTVTRGDLRANPRLCPVRITAGALGNGLPARDLLVSRQHRMMLSSDLAERLCGHREVLVPAIKLTGLKGVRVDSTAGRAGYVHIMFERHQIVFAEGAPSESFLPGPEGLKTLSAGQLGEFRMRFPAYAARDARAEPARPIVDGAEAKRLVAALAKSGVPVSGESDFAPERLLPHPAEQTGHASVC